MVVRFLVLICLVTASLAYAGLDRAGSTQVPWTHRNLDHAELNNPSTQPEARIIHPGDKLHIVIHDLVAPGVETREDVEIGEKGEVSLPLVPVPVKVNDLTATEAAAKIRELTSKASGNEVTVEVTFIDP